MPSMTEDLGRIAHGIAASRRERMEAAAEREREAAGRHRAVGHRLHEIKTNREKMGREQHRHAAAVSRRRVTETKAMLRLFHRNRRELAAGQRAQAAAFMRDLTGRVAELRAAFNVSKQARIKSRRASADALHVQLAGYRRDRRDADAAWRGVPPISPVGATGSAPGRHRSASTP